MLFASNNEKEGLPVTWNFGDKGETGDLQWFYLKERLMLSFIFSCRGYLADTEWYKKS